VRPVGGTDSIAVDVRIVAATHQELPRRIAEGRFRQDLYARLAGFELELPPVRERSEDLGTLIAALLPRMVPTGAAAVRIHRGAARALFAYGYPLNVRPRPCEHRAHRAPSMACARRTGHCASAWSRSCARPAAT
jgi:transcriptional regulator with GAF, ATPase, and Fis domain